MPMSKARDNSIDIVFLGCRMINYLTVNVSIKLYHFYYTVKYGIIIVVSKAFTENE